MTHKVAAKECLKYAADSICADLLGNTGREVIKKNQKKNTVLTIATRGVASIRTSRQRHHTETEAAGKEPKHGLPSGPNMMRRVTANLSLNLLLSTALSPLPRVTLV